MTPRPLGARCPECNEELTYEGPEMIAQIVRLRAPRQGCFVRCPHCGMPQVVREEHFRPRDDAASDDPDAG